MPREPTAIPVPLQERAAALGGRARARAGALLVAGLLALATPGFCEPVSRAYGGTNTAIATTVTVPAGATMVYVSGTIPAVADPKAPAGSIAAYGDTEQQTEGALRKIEAALAAQGCALADVVSMRVYLVGDPANGGRMDFAGMNRAYARHFGSQAQPDRPARNTVQVAGLSAPGVLVQIEVIAVKPAP